MVQKGAVLAATRSLVAPTAASRSVSSSPAGDAAPVPDAMVELCRQSTSSFGRCLAGVDGTFSFVLAPGGALDVSVFARGLLNRLVTRVYLPGDPALPGDPIIDLVPEERRSTLVAVAENDRRFHWDTRLQGAAETVFLAW